MKVASVIVTTLMLLVFSGISRSEQPNQYSKPIDKDLKLFETYFYGEFDNNNQVYFETNEFLENVPEEKHARLYVNRFKVEAPNLGKNVYYEETYKGGKGKKLYRQRVGIITPLEDSNTIYTESFKLLKSLDFKNSDQSSPLFASLKKTDLKSIGKNCGVKWQRRAQQFEGKITGKDCEIKSKHGGKKRYIQFEGILSDKESWALEGGIEADGSFAFGRKDGIHYQYRRADNYQCWVALKNDKNKWDFFQGLQLINQGGEAHFSSTDTAPKEYSIKLIETIFPAGKRPDVLELFVYKKGNDKSLSYTWTAAGTPLIGLNLRWIQTSCKSASDI